MKTLLEKTRQINELLQQKNTFNLASDLPYDKMAVILGNILDSNAYIISSDGSVLGFVETHDVNNERIKKMFVEKQFPKNYTNLVDNLS
jgi:transcriptional pleiotropic repressor